MGSTVREALCGMRREVYPAGSVISKYSSACAKKIQRERGIEGKRRSRERKIQVCIELFAKNERLTRNRDLVGLRVKEMKIKRCMFLVMLRSILLTHIFINLRKASRSFLRGL